MRSKNFPDLVRLLMLCLPAIFLLSCQSATRQPGMSDFAEIEAVLNQQKNAWNRGDIPGYMKGYLPDSSLTFVGANGVNRGYNTVLNRYLHNYPNREVMGQLDFSELTFVPAGEGFCLVTGKFTLHRQPEDATGYFTLLWKKTTDGWRIINDHTS